MLIHLTFLFLIIIDPLGNVPFFVSVLKHVDPARQKPIIMRELLIGLGVMIFFLFFGKTFFELLHVGEHALEITGGIILFIIALEMIFARHTSDGNARKLSKDPLIVPLAIPAVAGPAILAAIVLYGGGSTNRLIVLLAILISWALSVPILLLAPKIKKIIGENGAIAVERIFGYLVVLVAVDMISHGLKTFFGT